MNDYKISMIIPTFNAEDDIQRAMNSLINQTIGFENIEVVIVDDCSTDNTQKIILDYAEKYSNIKHIFLETNSGSAGRPRNIGIVNATAKYIMFLDNDDEYVPEACEIFYKKIEETGVNLIICSNSNRLFNSRNKVPKITEAPVFKEVNVLEDPDVLYPPISNYSAAMWCKIYKREFLLENNIRCLENLPEDDYFMHQCYYMNPNILLLTNLSLYNHYFYRTTGETTTVALSYKYLNRLLIVFDKLKDLSLKYENSEKFFNRSAQLFFNFYILKTITMNATKQEKFSLMKSFLKYESTFDFKPDHIIFSIWYKLVTRQRFKLCFIYSQIMKFTINTVFKITR